jgi:hypothetical protein
VQARHLLEEQPAGSEALSTDGQIGLTTIKTQMLHALYVAAHATSVALGGYQRDLQHRLDRAAADRAIARGRNAGLLQHMILSSLLTGSTTWASTNARNTLISPYAAANPGLVRPDMMQPTAAGSR